MSADELSRNKAAYRRFHDVLNSCDQALIDKMIDEMVEPDAVLRTPLPIEAKGPQLLKEVFAMLLRAFPDLHITNEDLIAEGDRVVARNVVTGTHQGEFKGRPATGATVSYNEVFIFRFVNERIAETWGVVEPPTLPG